MEGWGKKNSEGVEIGPPSQKAGLDISSVFNISFTSNCKVQGLALQAAAGCERPNSLDFFFPHMKLSINVSGCGKEIETLMLSSQ